MSKSNHKFQYPHPLIKNLYHQKFITSANIKELFKQKPGFYDTNYRFSPQIKTTISPKLLRLSHSKVVPEEKFGLLLQPFNSNQEVSKMSIKNELELKKWQCKNCSGLFNCQTESLSLDEVKCKICGNVQSIQMDVKRGLQDVGCWYDIVEEQQTLQEQHFQGQVQQKNFCFVIEASQYNYNYGVHKVIQNVISSLSLTTNINDQIMERKQSTSTCSQSELESSETVNHNENSQGCCQSQVNYNISFILFNSQNIYLINQETNDIMVFNQNFISEQQADDRSSQPVIRFNELFKPISQVSIETLELIQEILYTSYLKEKSCLDVVVKFIHKYVDCYKGNSSDSSYQLNRRNQINNLQQSQEKTLNRPISFKYLINSLKFNNSSSTSSINLKIAANNSIPSEIKGIFNNISNTITRSAQQARQSTIKSAKIQQFVKLQSKSQTQGSVLKLYGNHSFYYLPSTPHSEVQQKELFQKLNHNLEKAYYQCYQLNVQKLMDQLYYDLYQSLGKVQHYQVKLDIITDSNIQILNVGNSNLGYKDTTQPLKQISHSSTGILPLNNNKFHRYSVILNKLTNTSTLPIELQAIPQKMNTDKTKKSQQSKNQSHHSIQLCFTYSRHFTNSFNESQMLPYRRIFDVQVVSLNCSANYKNHIPNLLSTYADDQTMLYFYLRELFAECYSSKTNHTIGKKLYQKMFDFAGSFREQYGQLNFPKQYAKIFLYSFLLLNKDMLNSTSDNFYYHRHQWLNSSLESMAKTIYPRTYELKRHTDKQSPSIVSKIQVRNVKTAPKYFKTDSLILFQNGINLYLIIGQDITVQQSKNIFGTCFIHEIRQLNELPQLQTNLEYRNAIQLVRSYHESSFLPLQIIELFSPQFDSYIAPSLYILDNHYKYMRELWDMEPLKRKFRS